MPNSMKIMKDASIMIALTIAVVTGNVALMML